MVINERLGTVIILLFYLALLFSLSYLNGLFLAAALIFVLFLILKSKTSINKKILFSIICILTVGLSFMRGSSVVEGFKENPALVGMYEGTVKVVNKWEGKNSPGYEIILNELKEKKAVLYSDLDFQVGDILEITGELEEPPREKNKGGFSQKDYLKGQGISFICDLKKHQWIAKKETYYSFLYNYKEGLKNRLDGYLDEDQLLFTSLFLGDKRGLDEELKTQWQGLGISHLLAVSGTHVSMVMDICMFFIIAVPGGSNKKRVVLIGLLLLYTLLAFSPSVLRCFIFFLLVLLFKYLKIGASSIFMLGITSVILLIYNPLYIVNISFQLSFIIVFGLYYFSFLIRKKRGILVKLLFFGSTAFIFSFPILLYYFQKTSLASIIMTPLVLPVLELIIILGSFFLYFPFLNALLAPFGYGLKIVLSFLKGLTQTLDQLPSTLILGPRPPILLILGFYGLILIMPYLLRKGLKQFMVLSGSILCLLMVFFLMPHTTDTLDIHFINVGQGDSLLITTPKSHKKILMDGGRRSAFGDMGKKEVIPYLERQGLFHLDMIISSHGDEDHRGGLETVLEKLGADMILLPPLQYDEKEDYVVMVKNYRDLIQEVGTGDCFTIDGVFFEIINPEKAGAGKSSNEASLVVRITYAGTTVLLTGDGELEVLESLYEKGETIDYIIAPHHGSGKSFRKGIYKDLGVEAVFLSVGKNPYGHPDSSILEDLKASAIPYYRTDFNGTILLSIGEGVTIEPTY